MRVRCGSNCWRDGELLEWLGRVVYVGGTLGPFSHCSGLWSFCMMGGIPEGWRPCLLRVEICSSGGTWIFFIPDFMRCSFVFVREADFAAALVYD